MKVWYEEIHLKDTNTFKNLPTKVDMCCFDSMLWLFKNQLDMDLKESVFIRKSIGELTDLFAHCQFCGKRHEAEKIRVEKDGNHR